MDNIPDHIYFKDRQCRFIRNSRSQATLLGLHDPSEAIGKTDFDFFPHAAQSYADEQEVIRSGKPHVDFEEWVVWPDGREMWVSTTKMALRNSDGQTIGIFGISRDITERKRNEQAIRQLNSDLEKQAEQLQAAIKELEAFLILFPMTCARRCAPLMDIRASSWKIMNHSSTAKASGSVP